MLDPWVLSLAWRGLLRRRSDVALWVTHCCQGVLLVVAGCLSMGSGSHAEASGSLDRLGFTLTLDYHPFTQPTSTFIAYRRGAEVTIVDYSRQHLTVAARLGGSVSMADATALDDEVRSAAFRSALARCGLSGSGLTRGDQFTLTYVADGARPIHCAGFLDDAPKLIRPPVERLLGLRRGLQSLPVANAYLRSETIDAQRLQRIRSRGALPMVSLQALPAAVRGVVAEAIAAPARFVDLEEAQFSTLAALAAPGSTLFVTDPAAGGHQLTLFRPRAKPTS